MKTLQDRKLRSIVIDEELIENQRINLTILFPPSEVYGWNLPSHPGDLETCEHSDFFKTGSEGNAIPDTNHVFDKQDRLDCSGYCRVK